MGRSEKYMYYWLAGHYAAGCREIVEGHQTRIAGGFTMAFDRCESIFDQQGLVHVVPQPASGRFEVSMSRVHFSQGGWHLTIRGPRLISSLPCLLTDDPECQRIFHGHVDVDMSRWGWPEKTNAVLLDNGFAVRSELDVWQGVVYRSPVDDCVFLDAFGDAPVSFADTFYVDLPYSRYSTSEWTPLVRIGLLSQNEP